MPLKLFLFTFKVRNDFGISVNRRNNGIAPEDIAAGIKSEKDPIRIPMKCSHSKQNFEVALDPNHGNSIEVVINEHAGCDYCSEAFSATFKQLSVMMRVHKSPKEDIYLPVIDLLTLLFDSSWGQAQENTKIHIEAANPDNWITKAESRDLVRQIAYVLRHVYNIGVHKAGVDVVLTISSGNPFIPNIFYAIVAAGGIFSGAGTNFQVDELVRQLHDAKPKLLICSPDCEALAIAGAERYGMPRDRVITLDSKTPKRWRLNANNGSDVLQLCHGKKLDWARMTDLQTLKDTTTCLLYSSGTTGLPKGVRISHRGLVASTICTMNVAVRYQRAKKQEGKQFRFDTICHLPMANIAGVGLYSCNPFYMGGSTYWMEKYDFDAFIEYHRRYRPAYQFSVPPIWLRIAKSDKIFDHFDGLQVACTGSAPIGYPTIQELKPKLGKGRADITQTWGTTETSGVITALDWHVDDSSWSVGALCPNVTLRILDENDQDVEPGLPGELLIGGPILAQGYHNNPKIDKEAFLNGFYRTGDIGICRDGLVHIVDRKKELIKYKGNQVAPAELEALLTSHPQITDAAVIGIWDATQETELPRAYIVMKRKGEETTQAKLNITQFVQSKVADHKRLRGGIFFVDEIPKSPSGKILRKTLRAAAAGPTRPKL